MKTRTYFLLGLLGLLAAGITAAYQQAPGYMDADYYFATALRIVRGEGWTVPFLWNYLAGPSDVVQPSHAYWMPLATGVAAAGMFLSGAETFRAAQVLFILLSGAVPPLTAHLCLRITGSKRAAAAAGITAVFSGFYLPYLSTTDAFSPLMVLGAVYFLLLTRQGSWSQALLLGITAGGMHLARAEGMIWPILALVSLLLKGERKTGRYLYLVVGYLAVYGPWMVRNWIVFGNPGGPAGLQTMWLVDYDQLFVYPPDALNFSTWLSSGWRAIISARWWALKSNLGTTLAVQGEVFLMPWIVWGAVRWWKRSAVRVAAGAWILLFGMMTFIFPFQGLRGSYFHGAAALQPLIWSLAGGGFQEFLIWGKSARSWNEAQAWRVLGAGFLVILIVLSGLIGKRRVIGANWKNPDWNAYQQQYRQVEEALHDLGAGDSATVMVKNPPGYYLVSERPAVAVPFGGPDQVLAAAEKFQASYLILEADHPSGLKGLYQQKVVYPGVEYLGEVNSTQIYRLESK